MTDSRRPPRVADEVTWELVRDEWDLLLSIGSGPTSASAAADAMGASLADVAQRMTVLAEHGLVRAMEGGYGLIPAFYERREGMSSYLRDLVFQRLRSGEAAPIAGLIRTGLGDADALRRLVRRAEETLYPEVVAAASARESDRSERFVSVFVATARDAPTLRPADGDPFLGDLLSVLRTAAERRGQIADDPASLLWIAEMRVDPEVAEAIGEQFEDFINASPAEGGHGAAGFAIVPSRRRTIGGNNA